MRIMLEFRRCPCSLENNRVSYSKFVNVNFDGICKIVGI